jgi:hypothetical protein
MQWQREAPNPSDFDGFFGLTLPLLQRGVPVQAVSLDRASEPGYLKPFKTLLLTYDYQKPPDARTQTALAEWVKNGGSLLFFGGSDPYNAVADSWWRQAKRDTPQDDLWARLGLKLSGPTVTRTAPPEDTRRYTMLLQGDGNEKNLRNRRAYPFDLTRFVSPTGSVAVRFADVTPGDGWGALVASAELRIGGKLAASFRAGSEIENRFLLYDNGSQFNGEARFADGAASWTYQFDNLPRNQPVTLTVDMGNGFSVSAAAAQPDFGHTLLSVRESVLSKTFPRLRVGASYPVTTYPLTAATVNGVGQRQPAPKPLPALGTASLVRGGPNGGDSDAPLVLYNLRAGGAALWTQSVGKGALICVGVAPGFFTSSERSAGLLRALTQYAQQRAGGSYREPGALWLKRGRYTIVRTFGQPYPMEGRTIDLLAPTLPVALNRTIPPRSLALLYDFPSGTQPRLGFVSGRVQARVETANATAFFTRGPLNTNGVARLNSGGKKLTGVRALDYLGRPVAIQATVEGESVLLRYPNSPDGVVVRVGWE